MDLTSTVSAVAAIFRRHVGALLPFYLLGAAVPAIARVISLAGFVGAYVYLETTGRLARVRELAADRDLSPPDPEAGEEAIEEWLFEIEPILVELFSPVVLIIILLSLVGTVVLGLLLYAAVSAGQYAVCAGLMAGRDGLEAGIAGTRSHWLGMLGLYLLEAAIWIAVAFLALLAITVTALVSPILGLLVGLIVAVFSLVLLAVVRVVFAFAPLALVVDDVGVFEAISGAGGFIRANLMETIGYVVIALAALVGLSSLAGSLAVVGAGSVAGLLGLMVLPPALDLLKAGLYTDHRGIADPPTTPDVTIRSQIAGGLRRGLAELRSFVVDTPVLHAISVGIAAGCFAVGWYVAGPFEGILETSIEHRLIGHIPPAAAVEFFANNWTVAIATAFSGIALAIPAAVSLGFNGLVFGIYFRLEVAPMELVAFVIPHGIFELPALFIAGALGLWLGGVGWRTWRGSGTRGELASALERCFWVLIGVGILLAIAGLIEGFVSPYYYQFLL